MPVYEVSNDNRMLELDTDRFVILAGHILRVWDGGLSVDYDLGNVPLRTAYVLLGHPRSRTQIAVYRATDSIVHFAEGPFVDGVPGLNPTRVNEAATQAKSSPPPAANTPRPPRAKVAAFDTLKARNDETKAWAAATTSQVNAYRPNTW